MDDGSPGSALTRAARWKRPWERRPWHGSTATASSPLTDHRDMMWLRKASTVRCCPCSGLASQEVRATRSSKISSRDAHIVMSALDAFLQGAP
jgi:hypothetical protein